MNYFYNLNKKILIISFIIIGFLISQVVYANKKNVILAIHVPLVTLDPYNASYAVNLSATKSIYEGLFEFDETLKNLKNILALDYKISEDNLVYTFKLRPNVKFHDGTDFNAEAVKINLDRARNKDNKLLYYVQFNMIDKIKVIDDLTVEITLKEPFFQFIDHLAHQSAMIISPTALKKYGKDISFKPVGTGPFEFVDWKPSEHLKVKKNFNYWDKSKPKIDNLTFLTVTDSNTRASVVQTGEAQFAFPIPFELAKSDSITKNNNLEIINHKNANKITYLSINVLKKPYNDIRVRQAINHAINRQGLIKVVYNGFARNLNGIAPENVAFYSKVEPFKFDIKKAKELLKEAGYPNGFEAKLWTGSNDGTSVKIAQFLQQQLAQVGIKVKVEVLEPATSQARVFQVQKLEDAQIELFTAGWAPDFDTVDWILRPLFVTSSFPPTWHNKSYYSNETVDKLVADALKTDNKEEQQKMYKKAQEIVYKEAPAVFLASADNIYLKSKKLKGIFVSPDTTFYFADINLE